MLAGLSLRVLSLSVLGVFLLGVFARGLTALGAFARGLTALGVFALVLAMLGLFALSLLLLRLLRRGGLFHYAERLSQQPLHRRQLASDLGPKCFSCSDLLLDPDHPVAQPLTGDLHQQIQCGDAAGLIVADPVLRLSLAVGDFLLRLLLSLLPPASGVGLFSTTPAGRLGLQALTQLPGFGQQPIGLGTGTVPQQSRLLLGASSQLGCLVFGHLQHPLDPRGCPGQRRSLQAVQLSGRVLRIATKVFHLPGGLSRLIPRSLQLVAEVGGSLQRSIPFGSEGANSSFERVDVIDHLLAVEPAQHDLERRRYGKDLIPASVHVAGW